MASALPLLSVLLALVHNAHLHTDDRAFRSGKITKQNAHKRVLALDIQSLMNTALVLMREKKTYEDGLELGTSEMLDKISTTRPLKHTCNICTFTYSLL